MGRHNRTQEPIPVLEAVYDCPQQQSPTGYCWLCRWTLAFGNKVPQLAEPMFLRSNASRLDTSPITEGRSALSPNWRYFYHSDYLELTRDSVYEPATFLSTQGHRLPDKLDIPGIFYAVFSPNSKWLCGMALTRRLEADEIHGFYCVECASGKVHRLFAPPAMLVEFGWYPDSVHLWYAIEHPTRRRQVFKLNIRTSKRVLLSGVAAQAPFRNWALLDPRSRSMPSGGETKFVYAYNRAVRVRVEPTGDERMAAGGLNVYVEQRGGQVRQLLRHGDHSWMRIEPLDVLEDGEWVLLLCQRWTNSATGKQGAHSELVAFHTRTKQQLTYLSSQSSSFLFANWRFCRHLSGAIGLGKCGSERMHPR